MEFRIKKSNLIKEKQFNYFKRSLFTFFVFLFSLKSYTQDSIPAAKDVKEEKELAFQQFFFKALSQKAIKNYQKAIENLESCNQILSDNDAVYFEFSKNYLLLNNTLLAKEYIFKSLEKDHDNIWKLKHLVAIYVKENDFSEAIKSQQKIAAINSKESEYLIELFIKNKEYRKAIFLMNTLAKQNKLSPKFQRLKTRLEEHKKEIKKPIVTTDLLSLKQQFRANKSYQLLKQILQKEINNDDLLTYSEQGISLFPAQAFVYLTKAQALNNKKLHKKALSTLQNGIDFVIEGKMETNFYKEIATSYKGLGNLKDEKKYLEKSKN